MNIKRFLFKLLPVVMVLSLQTGCAIWTGGIPVSYKGVAEYPIIASNHGVKEIAYSDDLHKIVISYNPTNEITLNTNTTHGWLIHIRPADKELVCDEFYVLPKAARWTTNEKQTISMDATTCWTHFVVPRGEQYVGGGWGMSSDDPLGKYEIAVFLDHRLAANFKFDVTKLKSK